MAGGGEIELLIALNGRQAGKVAREVAVAIFGEKEVAREWKTSFWMRERARRRLKKAARFLKVRRDYRAMAALPG